MKPITTTEVVFVGLLALYLFTLIGAMLLRRRFHKHNPENRHGSQACQEEG